MLFNSFEYFVFFSGVLVISWVIADLSHLRTWFILAASLYFYYSNNHWQIALLLFATTVDYFVCLRMQQEKSVVGRRVLLAFSLISNLGMLFYFKYVNFFGETINNLTIFMGWKLDWVDLNVLLPVGISFYTFEALSYTIDVYRGEIKAEPKWNRLAFLVSFFPHLIAGPIVRARDFFPQLDARPRLSPEVLERAFCLIGTGLFKKMILADTLAIFADRAFDRIHTASAIDAWLGIYAFSFQIYFDFSGYTDVAIGCALLLGYRLPLNFRRPYVSASITEFWRRWHITLSTWLRDYLYISLGGNRTKRPWGTYRNLIVTMVLGGLWHGAAWHFAIWGLLHGVMLSIERRFKLTGLERGALERPHLSRIVRGFFVFQLVTLLWVPFRAPDLSVTRSIFSKMFSFESVGTVTVGSLMVSALIALAWSWQVFAERYPFRVPAGVGWIPVKAAGYAVLIVGVLVASSVPPRSFIYFQF